MGENKVNGFRPFSNGTEAGFFFEHNCESCKKDSEDYHDPDAGKCELQNALLDAGTMDGRIPLIIAARIGYNLKRKGTGYIPNCEEKDPK